MKTMIMLLIVSVFCCTGFCDTNETRKSSNYINVKEPTKNEKAIMELCKVIVLMNDRIMALEKYIEEEKVKREKSASFRAEKAKKAREKELITRAIERQKKFRNPKKAAK